MKRRRRQPSGDRIGGDAALDWFNTLSDALSRRERQVMASVGQPDLPEGFKGLTPPEVAQHFARLRKELDYQASLLFFAAAEGALQFDWQNRRDRVGRELARLRDRGTGGRLEVEDILARWCDHDPTFRRPVNSFRSALTFRHWLAHGRHWTLKLHQPLDARNVHRIAEAMFARLPDVRGWSQERSPNPASSARRAAHGAATART